jgi:hypothetical protein
MEVLDRFFEWPRAKKYFLTHKPEFILKLIEDCETEKRKLNFISEKIIIILNHAKNYTEQNFIKKTARVLNKNIKYDKTAPSYIEDCLRIKINGLTKPLQNKVRDILVNSGYNENTQQILNEIFHKNKERWGGGPDAELTDEQFLAKITRNGFAGNTIDKCVWSTEKITPEDKSLSPIKGGERGARGKRKSMATSPINLFQPTVSPKNANQVTPGSGLNMNGRSWQMKEAYLKNLNDALTPKNNLTRGDVASGKNLNG